MMSEKTKKFPGWAFIRPNSNIAAIWYNRHFYPMKCGPFMHDIDWNAVSEPMPCCAVSKGMCSNVDDRGNSEGT